MELELIIPGTKVREAVANYADASKKYRAHIEARDAEGFGGASQNSSGRVVQDGRVVAIVSYNGRVWEGDTYQPGAQPAYCPSQDTQANGDRLHSALLQKVELRRQRDLELVAGIIAEVRKLHGEDCTVRVSGGRCQAVRVSVGPRGGVKEKPLGPYWSCLTVLNCNPDTAAKVMTGVRA